jgi:hypothetical protein
MTNVIMKEFNGYASNDNGVNFRAVSCTENGKSVWRLAKEVKAGYQWDFVNEVRYETCENALADCDRY